MVTQISALPDPPTTTNPTNFDIKADAFVAAIPTFQTQANQLAMEVDQAAQLVVGTYATSTDTIAITNSGTVTTTVQVGKAFSVGMSVVLYNTTYPNLYWMAGQILTYSGSTGITTISVTSSYGSGSKTGWTLASSAPVLAPVIVGSIISLKANFGIF